MYRRLDPRLGPWHRISEYSDVLPTDYKPLRDSREEKRLASWKFAARSIRDPCNSLFDPRRFLSFSLTSTKRDEKKDDFSSRCWIIWTERETEIFSGMRRVELVSSSGTLFIERIIIMETRCPVPRVYKDASPSRLEADWNDAMRGRCDLQRRSSRDPRGTMGCLIESWIHLRNLRLEFSHRIVWLPRSFFSFFFSFFENSNKPISRSRSMMRRYNGNEIYRKYSKTCAIFSFKNPKIQSDRTEIDRYIDF